MGTEDVDGITGNEKIVIFCKDTGSSFPIIIWRSVLKLKLFNT